MSEDITETKSSKDIIIIDADPITGKPTGGREIISVTNQDGESGGLGEPKEPENTIIDVNPDSGRIRGIVHNPGEHEFLVNTSLQELQDLRQQQRDKERKIIEGIREHGEKTGERLSNLYYTEDGRQKIDSFMNFILKTYKGPFGSLEKARENTLALISDPVAFGNSESLKKLVDNWEKQNKKRYNSSELYIHGKDFQDEMKHLAHDISQIRSYLSGGGLEIDMPYYLLSSHSKDEGIVQNAYREGFVKEWNNARDRSVAEPSEKPWYVDTRVYKEI